jgi:SAM-dependent methyltransferase
MDAGCGSGLPVSGWLLEAGYQVVGLDFSFGQLSLVRTVLPESRVVQGELTALPFLGGQFAAASVSHYAIIHVPRAEHEHLLKEIHQVLRPSGCALPCLGWGDLPEDHDPDSWLGVPMFWSHFDELTNLELLQQVGFTVQWSRRVDDPTGHGAHQFVLATRS